MVVLLDTNVLIDYFGKREPFYEEATKLKVMAIFGDVNLWAASNSLTDVFYVLHKEHMSEAVQQSFVASKGHLGICSVTADDVYQAATEGWSDFEDCLIDVCAQKLKADYILTRDPNGFSKTHTSCMTPSEFLSKVAGELDLVYAEIAIPNAQG